MKLPYATTLTLILASGLLRINAAEVLPVAVFDFESKDESVRDLGPKVAVLVNVNLTTDPEIITVERAELDKVLGEQELGLSGNVRADTVAKVGQLTGAKVLITGKVFKADKELIIVSRIIGAETSRVYAEMVKGPASTPLTDLCAELAKKIVQTVEQKGESLIAKQDNPEEIISKIKKGLHATPLPTVTIKITERHFGRSVIDPAAETELGLILQKCGFTVISSTATSSADVELGGEAFSAFGIQKGNLVSCKARVELKAVKSNGDILAIDRQTSMAVDIAEQTAAKTALQHATVELAQRIIPLISK